MFILTKFSRDPFRIFRCVKGQATSEMVMMTAVVVILFLVVARGIREQELPAKMVSPIKTKFKYTYKYGNSKTQGFEDEDGPVNHPRINESGNFRIFINDQP